jgi:hypothetical protein
MSDDLTPNQAAVILDNVETMAFRVEQHHGFTVRGRIWCSDRTLMTGTGVYEGLRDIVRRPRDREARA